MSYDHDELGYVDALAIVNNPSIKDQKLMGTARQHVKRYEFADSFVVGKNILDVACGVGYGSVVMKHAASYTGADIDEAAISEAKQAYGETTGRKFFAYDARTLSRFFSEGQFDTVVSFETIEHFREYEAFLAGVYKILKPDGELIISTPNRNITNPGKTLSDPTTWKHHTQEWIESEFLALLIAHHFKILRVYGQSFIVKSALRKIFRGSGRVVKSLTQGILPIRSLSLISEPGFMIVRARK